MSGAGRPDILVIKHGALGDLVQALGAIRAIRDHHADARIVLLTTAPYAGFMRACPWIDDVWIDARPKAWQPVAILGLVRRLRSRSFARVYDLQTSERTAWYFRLLGPRRPAWSGIARGCSHPHDDPRRDRLHTHDRLKGQLAAAGLPGMLRPDVGWALAETAHLGVAEPFALLAPGSAPSRLAKRWPAERFGALAAWLAGQGLRPVLIGTAAEAEALARVRGRCPQAIDLGGRTTLAELAALARRARLAVGNDSGPMHLIATAGCPSVVLFSAASDPELTAPRGPAVHVLRRERLADLALKDVLAALPANGAGLLDTPSIRTNVRVP